jgi:C-terminal processing protease CtpA/Prc
VRTFRHLGVATSTRCAAGISLAALAFTGLQAHAQTNLDFETAAAGEAGVLHGWRSNDDDISITLDSIVAHTGAHSLRIERTDSSGRGRFSQLLDARDVPTDRIRVSAWVKTDESAASLRIRVDGGGSLLYMSRSRAQGGPDSRDWRRIVIDAPLAPNAERISFGGELDGHGIAWFDDFSVEAVRTSELPAPTSIATRYLRQALDLIDEHAVTRADLDWPAYRGAVMAHARGAVTTADAHLAVQYALSRLGDGHSYFMSPRQMANLERGPVGNARSGREPRAPRAELLFGAIGYIRLPGFAGGEHMDRVVFAEELQSIIGKLESAGADRWILDLRDNQGGNLWPMLAGLGPLLGDGEAGASLRPDGERRRIWYEDGKVGLGDYVQLRVRGEPYRLQYSGAPVAVLQDDETASAAEIVAAAFAARPQTRSFGSATRGATTATRTFPLMDGAALMLAVASTVDRNGRVLNGPIAPDEIVADAEREQDLGSQWIIEAARQWLDGLAK